MKVPNAHMHIQNVGEGHSSLRHRNVTEAAFFLIKRERNK
jgi:hypothetical protein